MSSRRQPMPHELLAIEGGAPACPAGPPRWPPADEAVREALEQAFRDGSWGSYHGRYVRQLAQELAAYHEVEFVTLCCSGTFAVELALRGLGIGPGDEVVLAGYDFPGNFRSIEATGARPVLVDVDPHNWNLDPQQLAGAVGPRTKAVIVSHLHGGVVPMREVVEVAQERGVAVVEDACQCPGAVIEGRRAGTWGDVGVLSFGGSKLLSAGRGGAIITRREDVHQRAKLFAQRGNDAFPLSELQAAVLRPQLARLDERNARRARAVAQLAEHWESLPGLRLFHNRTSATSPGYYKLGLQYLPAAEASRPARAGAEAGEPQGDAARSELAGELPSREKFIQMVQAEGIALDAGFRGFVLRSARRCRSVGPLEESRRAADGCLVLHHPVLLEPDEVLDQVAGGIEKVARRVLVR